MQVKVARVATNLGVPVGKLACQELLAPLQLTQQDYEERMREVTDLKLYLTNLVLDVHQDRCQAFKEQYTTMYMGTQLSLEDERQKQNAKLEELYGNPSDREGFEDFKREKR